MKTIDIRITKAKIERYNVDLDEEFPSVSATIGLYTDAGQKISDFSMSTKNYYGHEQFELPVEMMISLKEIAKQLEDITIGIAQRETRLLPEAI